MCKALEKFINLKTYPYFPKETFVERVKIRLNLIKKGHSLEFVNKEVCNLSCNKIVDPKFKYVDYNCIHHYYYILAKLKKDKDAMNILLTTHANNFDIFKLRENMLKENSSLGNIEIEKLISQKYNLGHPGPCIQFTDNFNPVLINMVYEQLRIYYSNFKKGRPKKLDNTVKINKNKEKMKMIMSNKYKELNKYRTHLFTKEEKDYLLQLSMSDELREKINIFSKNL
jgi:hypothetical protein